MKLAQMYEFTAESPQEKKRLVSPYIKHKSVYTPTS